VESGGQRWRLQKDGEAMMTTLRNVAVAMVLSSVVATNVATDTSFTQSTRHHFDQYEKRARAAASTAAQRAPLRLHVDDPWADEHQE
jgi:hypothetical protein